MRRPAGLLLGALACLLAAPAARAGGFLIYEHNAAATGMCGARSAVAGDPSAVFYNPAAITELPGLQLQLGLTGILPLVRYEAENRQPPRRYPEDLGGGIINDGQNDADAKVKGYNPVHLYATWDALDLGFSLGLGLTNPFGLGTYWPGDWDGRFITTETEIKTYFPNLVVAVDVARLAGFKEDFKLSLAAGYTLIYGQARLSKKLDLSGAATFDPSIAADAEGELRMTGDGVGHGWNLALYAEWPARLAFGFSIRGGGNPDGSMAVPFEGPARFSFDEQGARARAVFAATGIVIPDETTGRVRIDLPLHFNLGVAFLGIEDLVLAADFYLADFRSYDRLGMELACADRSQGTCSQSLEKSVEKRWGVSWQVSLGAEYVLLDAWALRLGYGTASSPVPEDTYDPSLPDGQRQLFTAGAGYRWSWGKLDLGYMLAFWSGAKHNRVGEGEPPNFEGMANGRYSTQSHLLGLTFTAAL